MRALLKALNITVLVLLVLGVGAMVLSGTGGEALSALLLGAVMIGAASGLALRAIRAGQGTSGARIAAYAVNGLVLVGTVVGMFVPDEGVTDSSSASAAELFGMSLPMLACVLNLVGIRRLAARMAQSEPAQVRGGGYLRRHWRGDQSLGVSYWVNGVLFSGAFGLLGAATPALLDDLSLRGNSVIALGIILFATALTVWSLVGIWRSSRRHTSRGGSRGWANAARVMVVIGVLGFGSTFITQLLPQLKEHALIAAGRDPLGKLDVKITANGQALVLRGNLATGSAEHVRALLDAAPAVSTLMLTSNGGRIREAQRIATLVRERKLATYVESYCESACTFIFLAGTDRAATPAAKLGFHRPHFPGMDPATDQQMTRSMMADYRAAGLSEAFISRIRQTAPESMWYPTHAQLIADQVINRLSLGGEHASLATNFKATSLEDFEKAMRAQPMLAALERHFPGAVRGAAQSAWREYSAGASDGTVTAAARAIVVQHIPGILGGANDAQLESFVSLMLEQSRAAQAVSDEACARLIEGKLDIQKALPPQLGTREMALMLEVLTGPMARRSKVDPQLADRALGEVFANLTSSQLQVLGEMPAYRTQPGAQCDATIALYASLQKMTPQIRGIALQAMFEDAQETRAPQVSTRGPPG